MIEIRRATQNDGEIAFEIRRQAIRAQCAGSYSHEVLMAWTAGAAQDGYSDLMEGHFYLGSIEGITVVTGLLEVGKREIGAIFVDPGYLRQGAGRQMLTFLEDLARELGFKDVNLEATLNAADFYRRCGYVGDEVAVYHSPSGLKLACIPMEKQLACQPVVGK